MNAVRNWFRECSEGWDRFWFTPRQPHTLAVIRIATGAMLFVLITILGPVSGGHFNPAVSLVAALQRALPWRDAARYIAAQVVGGIAGTMLAHAMFDLPLLQWVYHPVHL